MSSNLLITFSFGQSLSIGTTFSFERLSVEAEHPGAVLGLDFGNPQTTARGFRGDAVDEDAFVGFVDLIEGDRESPASAMLNQIHDAFEADGLEAPTLVHFHAGHGGRSILELMTSSSDIFGSVEAGLLEVEDGHHFAIENDDGTLSHYINDGGAAVHTKDTDGGAVYYDNLESQLRLVVEHALEQGLTIDPSVVMNWIHGQSDKDLSRALEFDYQYHLNLLLDKITETIHEIVSPSAQLVASISQFRGSGVRETPIQTLDVINDRDDTHLGAVEYAFQAFEPSLIGTDYTHLTSEGYYRIGRLLGARIYDALSGNENQPILMDAVEFESATEVIVTFSGVETYLVDDPSIYRAEAGFTAPEHFGFGLYAANGTPGSDTPNIVESEIVGPNQVRLVFDQPLDEEYRLFLGRTGENLVDPSVSANRGVDFGGTTLRDASETLAPTPTSGRALDDNAISEYAPIQAIQIPAFSGGDEALLINGFATDVGAFLEGAYDFGHSDVSGDGASVVLSGNAWRQALADIEITADTVLRFDFASYGVAEIQGIMFVNDENPAATQSFQLDGLQRYGRQDFAGQYAGDGEFQSYEIPIGEFFTGTFDRIVFLNDDDARNGGSSSFANLTLETDVSTVPEDDEALLINGFATDVGAFLEGAYDFGHSDVSGDGASVVLSGNAWRQALADIEITADTVLRFDFASYGVAEIQGIMFVNDENPAATQSFQLDGLQRYGRQDFAGQYAGDGEFQSYEIPIGEFFTGTFDRIVFLNDDDARNGGSSSFANLTLETGGSSQSSDDADSPIQSQLDAFLDAVLDDSSAGDNSDDAAVWAALLINDGAADQPEFVEYSIAHQSGQGAGSLFVMPSVQLDAIWLDGIQPENFG